MPEGGKATGEKRDGVWGSSQLVAIPSTCTKSTERRVGSRWAVMAPVASEGHTATAVAQHTGQDASVQLVEFHELQQVCETGLAVVHAKVQAALIFAR